LEVSTSEKLKKFREINVYRHETMGLNALAMLGTFFQEISRNSRNFHCFTKSFRRFLKCFFFEFEDAPDFLETDYFGGIGLQERVKNL